MKCPRGTRPALIYTQGDTSLSIWTWIWVFLNQVKNSKMKKRNKVQWIWFVFLSLNFIFLSAIAWEIQVGNRLCLMVCICYFGNGVQNGAIFIYCIRIP